MTGMGFAGLQPALFIEIEYYRGNFQQGVAFGVKAAGFHVDNHGQETSKTGRQSGGAVSV
jgi:hypothetical protein